MKPKLGLGTNYVPQPGPTFAPSIPRNLIFPQRTPCAPVFDPTRNARVNNRSYHVETAWEASQLTKPGRAEKHTFIRWNEE